MTLCPECGEPLTETGQCWQCVIDFQYKAKKAINRYGQLKLSNDIMFALGLIISFPCIIVSTVELSSIFFSIGFGIMILTLFCDPPKPPFELYLVAYPQKSLSEILTIAKSDDAEGLFQSLQAVGVQKELKKDAE